MLPPFPHPAKSTRPILKHQPQTIAPPCIWPILKQQPQTIAPPCIWPILKQQPDYGTPWYLAHPETAATDHGTPQYLAYPETAATDHGTPQYLAYPETAATDHSTSPPPPPPPPSIWPILKHQRQILLTYSNQHGCAIPSRYTCMANPASVPSWNLGELNSLPQKLKFYEFSKSGTVVVSGSGSVACTL